MLAVANLEAAGFGASGFGSGFGSCLDSGAAEGVLLKLRGSAPNGTTRGALFCVSLCSSIRLLVGFLGEVALVTAVD